MGRGGFGGFVFAPWGRNRGFWFENRGPWVCFAPRVNHGDPKHGGVRGFWGVGRSGEDRRVVFAHFKKRELSGNVAVGQLVSWGGRRAAQKPRTAKKREGRWFVLQKSRRGEDEGGGLVPHP